VEIICTKSEIGKHDTHVVDIAIRSRKEIQSPGEVLLNLGPDGHMCSPGVTLFPLGVDQIRGDNMHSPVATFFPLDVGEIRGDPGLNNRIVGPMTGPLGRPRAEHTLGGRDELGNPGRGASRGGRVDIL